MAALEELTAEGVQDCLVCRLELLSSGNMQASLHSTGLKTLWEKRRLYAC